SDWGHINNSNIRRGLLFNHAFASWAPQDISSRGPLPPKIFEDNTRPSLPPISQDAALPHTTPSSLTPSSIPPQDAAVLHTSPTSPIPSPLPLLTQSTPAIPVTPAHPLPTTRKPRKRKAAKTRSAGQQVDAGSSVLPAGAVAQVQQKRGISSIANPEPSTSKKRALPEVAKVQVEDKGFIQIKVSAWGASNVEEDLQNFANGDENGGGLYELTGTQAWMAVDSMFAHKPGAAPVPRVVAHDLEGYYYVILSLAFMFNEPYVLKPLPGRDTPEESDHYLGIWLENATEEVAIWREAARKERFFCNHDGFRLLEGRLGREWSCEAIKTMLREMRDLLFYEKAVTHAGMIHIIQRALDSLSTDHPDLCKPVPMTEEWHNATGAPGVATSSCRLPAMHMNIMHHQIGHTNANIASNLFACMPCPPDEEQALGPASSSKVLKGSGMWTRDRVRLVAPTRVSGSKWQADFAC
ncbi:hypothetical protein BDR06DRAFT_1010962, partial [Suillus hirtellus]